jgi:transposase-like protein
MKYSAEEKIRIVIEGLRGESSIAQLCRKEGISRSTFYEWYRNYVENGFYGLKPKVANRKSFWNKIPDKRRNEVVEIALDQTVLSPGVTDHLYGTTDPQSDLYGEGANLVSGMMGWYNLFAAGFGLVVFLLWLPQCLYYLLKMLKGSYMYDFYYFRNFYLKYNEQLL